MALEDAKNQVDTAFTRNGLRGHAFENAFAGATSFLRRTKRARLFREHMDREVTALAAKFGAAAV